jgi:hypothetical protein
VEEKRARRRRITVAQLGAYLLICVVAVLGFLDLEHTQDELCQTAAENRQASRDIVQAIDRLGVGLILEGREESEASPEEAAAIKLLDQFAAEQLALLDKPVCESLIGGPDQ